MHRPPVIAPGLPVLTRPDGDLQIGLSGRHRLRLSDSAAARRTLAALARGESPTDWEGRRVLRSLAPALRDRDTLVQPGLADAEMAALSLRHPQTAQARATARRGTSVRVVGDLGVDPRPLLTASGLAVDLAVDQALDQDGLRTVTLMLCRGEPDRAGLDPLLRVRQPYLLLRAVEGEMLLGPFVDPGRTACLRCVDAHLTEDDPLHPVLVSRSARLLERSPAPEPVDTALAAMAIGWAVRDLVRYAEGDPVSTWSATVRLEAEQAAFAPVSWSPHPACGCSWARSADFTDGEGSSVTMGA